MNYSTRYSKRLVLGDLRAFAGRVRRPPRQIDLGRRNKLPSYPVIERLFGSWTGCLKALGYPARWIQKRWTKRELIQIIRNLSFEVKRTPTLLDLQARTNQGLPNQHVFTRVFGGWDPAIREAGLDLEERQLFWRRWQRLVVKAAIALYGRENVITGHVPGIRGTVDSYVKSHRLVIDAMTSGYEHAYKAGEIPRYTRGQRQLEFWCAHRGVREYKAPRLRYRYASDIAAMLSRKGHATLAHHVLNYAKGEAALYTDEFLLKLVRQLARRLGRTPRLKDFDSDPEMPTGALIFRRFGSLKNACKRAGITYIPSQYSRRYTGNELLMSLRQVWRRLKRPPTVYDFGNIKGRPSVQAIARAFGTCNRALRAAEIPLNRPSYSKQQMVALYKRVTAARGGQAPSSKDWERLRREPRFRSWSLPSSRTMIRKIGWNNLVSAAGFPVKTSYTQHEIVRALRLYKRRTGAVPSAPTFDTFRNTHLQLRLPDSGRIKREFLGSFFAARKAAGL